MTKTIGAGTSDGSPFEGLRTLRIPTFTTTSVCLGVVAHIAAGGSLPVRE